MWVLRAGEREAQRETGQEWQWLPPPAQLLQCRTALATQCLRLARRGSSGQAAMIATGYRFYVSQTAVPPYGVPYYKQTNNNFRDVILLFERKYSHIQKRLALQALIGLLIPPIAPLSYLD
ncbi:UNVERIFIED_CONTAM: hypothetical protein K2H54_042711 [Gekko kuhli]